jgi:hypothetical protein
MACRPLQRRSDLRFARWQDDSRTAEKPNSIERLLRVKAEQTSLDRTAQRRQATTAIFAFILLSKLTHKTYE